MSDSAPDRLEKIKDVQRIVGTEPDGVWGPKSRAALEALVAAPITPTNGCGLPQKALDLILSEEGVDQPSKWPGGASGITIGHGYDLGYEETFLSDWAGVLSIDELDRLHAAIHVTGSRARDLAPRFADIKITQADADTVFYEKTLPKYVAITARAFPGFDKLPALAQGALVSLVFNRGPSMTGDTREEMRGIRDAVEAGDLWEIARLLELMKRLWIGKGLDGLLARRDREAALVREAIMT